MQCLKEQVHPGHIHSSFRLQSILYDRGIRFTLCREAIVPLSRARLKTRSSRTQCSIAECNMSYYHALSLYTYASDYTQRPLIRRKWRSFSLAGWFKYRILRFWNCKWSPARQSTEQKGSETKSSSNLFPGSAWHRLELPQKLCLFIALYSDSPSCKLRFTNFWAGFR